MTGRLALLVAAVAVGAGCSSGSGGTTSTAADVVPPTSSTVASPANSLSTTTAVTGDPLADPEFIAWAVKSGFLNDDGYFGPVDVAGNPFRLDPIAGYADLSNLTAQEVFDLDQAEIDLTLTQCVLDQDARFVDGVGEDGRFFWGRLRDGLDQIGWATYVACLEGLNRPPPSPLTDDQWEERYSYLMAVLDCEESHGALWFQRVSLDEFKANDGSWEYDFDPYQDLAIPLVELQHLCPANPVGGFGRWDPGDPVVPAP